MQAKSCIRPAMDSAVFRFAHRMCTCMHALHAYACTFNLFQVVNLAKTEANHPLHVGGDGVDNPSEVVVSVQQLLLVAIRELRLATSPAAQDHCSHQCARG